MVVPQWLSHSDCTVVLTQWSWHIGLDTVVVTPWLSHCSCHIGARHTNVIVRQSLRQICHLLRSLWAWKTFSLVTLQATAVNRCKKVVEEGIYCQRPRLVPHQDDEGAITSLHLLRTSPFPWRFIRSVKNSILLLWLSRFAVEKFYLLFQVLESRNIVYGKDV